MRRWFALVALVLASCPPAGSGPPAAVPDRSVAVSASSLLVAAPRTTLWSKAGGTGSVVGTLHQGVKVVEEERTGDWSLLVTGEAIAVRGWVRSADLGCRVATDTTIQASPGEDAPQGPLARAGCMMRVLEISNGWIRVMTAPEPFTYFEKGQSFKDPVVTHTKFAGFIVDGWIPAVTCTSDPKPFYPRAPKDGELQIIKTPSSVLHSPGGIANQIPGEALPWTRWVTMEVDGTWARGRTDGQVVVQGWVPLTSIGPLPNTNPLNKLAEKKLKDFEVVASSQISDAEGHEITTLPGGQEVDKIDEDVRGCKVRTMPPIEVEGWLPCSSLRNLSVLPEAVIEYGIIDGGAWPPDRGPVPNPLPPWPEDVEDEVGGD